MIVSGDVPSSERKELVEVGGTSGERTQQVKGVLRVLAAEFTSTVAETSLIIPVPIVNSLASQNPTFLSLLGPLSLYNSFPLAVCKLSLCSSMNSEH